MPKPQRIDDSYLLRKVLSDGKFFSVKFVKRTTGEERHMLCRTGVKVHLKGGGRAWSDEDKNVLTVWDVQKKDYRCIPLEALIEVRYHGQVVKRKRK